MKRLLAVLAAGAALAVIGVSAAISSGDGRSVLKFDTMTPVVSPYTGSTNPIRGVNGGGIPWVIDSAHGKLNADGRLRVEVDGLVLATTGVNPSPTFEAIVSCMSVDTAGQPSTVNVSTNPLPATPTGDAKIDATVSLPSPCIAPIVFVASGGGSWFAATGL
ncbi:MAG TPA: hypothetical protein VFW80_07540 [Gaiellaceae bacterium]|nr:hypothetical protein [Gaiellaceae bacterium]